MSLPQHIVRTSLILLWLGWLGYTCFKRAIEPPKDRISWAYTEVEKVNRNPFVRALNILVGLLVLWIGIDVAIGK